MLVFLIGTTYSVLAPVVNVFAATYFGLYYLVYHHQFLYVYDHRKFSTGGLTFPRAIVQMFFGIYVFEVVFLVQIISVSVQNWLSTLRILVVVLIIFGTVLTNIVTVKAYFPLTKYLPVSEFGNINQGRRRKARKRDKLAALLFKKSRRNRAGDGDTVSLVNKGSDSDSSDNDYSSDEAATNTTAGKNTLGAHPANEYEWEQNIKDGYYHPDLKLDDKVELWLPEDKYGLREKIVQHMLAHDGEYITFKLEGAVLDEKSRIKVVL
ncbi:hypothetical protein EV182_005616 [Spiromyces aspiralis]|uniref:Uncharacterized protein n=1 Tax=Spiromyces aspiralis TaxID=68401 RepID=A0ACC1HR17_9FUNG|nr:hypothetical protein EV182_005616 [Spiromyces aspiralis]